MSSKKNIVVIGAGASGLPAIKACLDAGLNVTCLEKSIDLGGLWRYTETPVEGESCVMKSTIINTSKEIMAYSDFPAPADFPNYMHNTQVLDYFRMYAEKFDLVKHIRFNTEVVKVEKSDDFSSTGRWAVTTRDLVEGSAMGKGDKREVYDGVMVCTGHHADKNMPSFPGQESFRGTVVHTHDFRNPHEYRDKKVVVIGIGNSGGDVSVELSRVAKMVYLSTRRGSWILNRVNANGLPLDLVFAKRPLTVMSKTFPAYTQKKSMEALNQRLDHELYGLKPDFPPSAQHPTINDDMPNRILAGFLKVKDNVKCFHERAVDFVDGSREEDIDAVVMATGYVFGFPFIDKSVIDVKENQTHLYKHMFQPDLQHQTLSVIGCFQPLGAVMPMSELQARLAVGVIKGEIVLPPRDEMWRDIREREAALAKRYVKSKRHTIQVDLIPYMDELADLIGCRPNFKQLLLSDPRFALKLYFGPAYPYQYRLMGPNPWPEARQAILTAHDRVTAPLSTRRVVKEGSHGFSLTKMAAILLVVYFLFRFLFY